jgi:hypothetical protein
MTPVHFFTDEGSLCRAEAASRLSVVAASVTCAACGEILRERERDESTRPAPPPPRVLARLRRSRAA